MPLPLEGNAALGLREFSVDCLTVQCSAVQRERDGRGRCSADERGASRNGSRWGAVDEGEERVAFKSRKDNCGLLRRRTEGKDLEGIGIRKMGADCGVVQMYQR